MKDNTLYVLGGIAIISVGVALICLSRQHSTVDLANDASNKFYKCVEQKHRQDLCFKEVEEAYQRLCELDVEEKIGEEIQEEKDFRRVAFSCWATRECKTYSCLSKNLWRCK